MPGREVAGARQSGCMRQTIGSQVLGRQVAGAGQTGRPSGPGKAGLVVQIRKSRVAGLEVQGSISKGPG